MWSEDKQIKHKFITHNEGKCIDLVPTLFTNMLKESTKHGEVKFQMCEENLMIGFSLP